MHFRVRGSSMEPTIRDGDVVDVDPEAYADAPPQPGDVILARHPFVRDLRIVKRVARVVPEGLVLRGDNPDPLQTTDSRSYGPLPLERVLGRVVLPE